MTDTSKTFGGPQPANFVTWNPIALVSFPVGTPLTGTTIADNVGPASQLPSSPPLNFVVGLAATPGAAGSPVHVKYAGPLDLTIEEWDLITGQVGGLSFGNYFLSTTTPGKLQNADPGPTGTLVGRAISPTTLFIQPQNI